MKQVYRIDNDGFYLEPVILHLETIEVEVKLPIPVTEEKIIEGEIESEDPPVEEQELEPEILDEPPYDVSETEEEPVESTEPVEETPEEAEEEIPQPNKIIVLEYIYNVPEDCVEVAPPSFYKAKWDGEEWIEVGVKPPEPPPKVTNREMIEQLQNEALSMMIALTDGYEEQLASQAKITDESTETMVALSDVFEQVLTLQEDVMNIQIQLEEGV